MEESMTDIFKILAWGTVSLVLLAGCTTTAKVTQSTRAVVDQLLVTEALMRTLANQNNEPLPIPPGSPVVVTTAGLTTDQTFLVPALNGWLGQLGYVLKGDNNAKYRIDVIVKALGTETDETFFGVPPIQSMLIPFSVPEIAIYKAQRQNGFSKFHMNVFEIPEGKFVGSTPDFFANSYYNSYTFLAVFSRVLTDLPNYPILDAHDNEIWNPKNDKAKSGEAK